MSTSAASVMYASSPYPKHREWTRHWLMKGAEILAHVDTHPAHGLDAVKLSNLFVPPEHRGHDYGRQVIKQAMARFPERDVVITPNPWRDKAVPREKLAAIYASLGFKKMAGTRYENLMIFERPFAFKLGAVTARSVTNVTDL